MQLSAPSWKWEWNLNTIAILIGFAAGLVAWGWTLNELQTGRSTNAANIERLDTRLTALEVSTRRLDNHELRIGNVEKQATDAATAMRAVEATLNGLAADMRVTREILQRLEAASSGQRGG
ncbi:MAG TPA: hypothetical protein VNS02_09670 [Rhizobiaceae bacterium]|nr:hypothetical protein [Rhizobiaceae bacterium]